MWKFIVFVVIVILTFSPIILALLGAGAAQFLGCKVDVYTLSVLPWFMVFTLPVGGVVAFLWLIACLFI